MRSTFLRTAEAAQLLGLSPRTLERWRVVGSGPTYRKHGRVVAYAEADLAEWSRKQKRRSTSDPGVDHDSR